MASPLPPVVDLPAEKPFVIESAPQLERTASSADGRRLDGWRQPPTRVRFKDTDTAFEFETSAAFAVGLQDPSSATARFEHRASYHRPDGTAVIDSSLSASATEGEYLLNGELTVTWNGQGMAERRWTARIPRRFG